LDLSGAVCQLNPILSEGSMEVIGSRFCADGLSDSDVALVEGMYRDVWCQLNPFLSEECSMEVEAGFVWMVVGQ
jgi:hypothetical protein